MSQCVVGLPDAMTEQRIHHEQGNWRGRRTWALDPTMGLDGMRYDWDRTPTLNQVMWVADEERGPRKEKTWQEFNCVSLLEASSCCPQKETDKRDIVIITGKSLTAKTTEDRKWVALINSEFPIIRSMQGETGWPLVKDTKPWMSY